jgi:hypothetical protein
MAFQAMIHGQDAPATSGRGTSGAHVRQAAQLAPRGLPRSRRMLSSAANCNAGDGGRAYARIPPGSLLILASPYLVDDNIHKERGISP